MKFRLGPRPHSDPAPNTVRFFRLGAAWLQLAALPLGAAVAFGIWQAWLPVVDWGRNGPGSGVEFVGMLATLFILHELTHLLLLPSRGWRRATLVAWPARLQLHVEYDGTFSRSEYARCALAPVLVLSLVPTGWAWLSGHGSPWLAWAAVANCLVSSMDLAVVGLVLARVPARARFGFFADGCYAEQNG